MESEEIRPNEPAYTRRGRSPAVGATVGARDGGTQEHSSGGARGGRWDAPESTAAAEQHQPKHWEREVGWAATVRFALPH